MLILDLPRCGLKYCRGAAVIDLALTGLLRTVSPCSFEACGSSVVHRDDSGSSQCSSVDGSRICSQKVGPVTWPLVAFYDLALL